MTWRRLRTTDYRPDQVSVAQLRENLFDLRVALADARSAHDDPDRLRDLLRLYRATRDALARRDLKVVRVDAPAETVL